MAEYIFSFKYFFINKTRFPKKKFSAEKYFNDETRFPKLIFFSRVFPQLIVNSLYGKLIESVTKRMDVRFNFSAREAMRNATSPVFKSMMILSEHCSLSFSGKKHLQMDKNQWAIGFTVLELSKLVMQRTFYDVIQPKFGQRNVEVLMSDTDSFLLRINTDKSETEVMNTLTDIMDFSNYPKDHPLYDNSHAKELGRLKNELPTKEIVSFVGLKSKTYAIKVRGGSIDMKAKGVPRRTKKKIPFEAMLDCLRQIQSFSTSFNRIQSRDHIVRMVHCEKTAFSSFDDKRFLLCENHSVPYGSKFVKYFWEADRTCPFCQCLSEKYVRMRKMGNSNAVGMDLIAYLPAPDSPRQSTPSCSTADDNDKWSVDTATVLKTVDSMLSQEGVTVESIVSEKY